MMTNFREIKPTEMSDNFIRSIGQEWMLITAGDRQRCNAMTASWGMVGQMWGKPAAMVVVRPQRFTRELVEANETLSLAFFDAAYHSALEYCGSRSGRDEDKLRNAGLTVEFTQEGAPIIQEARLVLECRKLYRDDLREEAFLDPELAGRWYPQKDYHRMYLLEILRVYVRK